MPDSNLMYPPTPEKEEPWWKPKNLPWWTPTQSQYYESLPFGEKPFTGFGLIPPKVPFPEPPAKQPWEQQAPLPTLEEIMAMNVSLEEKDAMVKMWHPNRYAEWQQQVNELAKQEEAMQAPEFPKTAPPEGYRWVWSDSSLSYVLDPIPYQKAQTEVAQALAERKFQKEQEAAAARSRQESKAQTTERKQYEEQQAWQREQAGVQQQQYEQQMAMERQQYQWQQQQAEQRAAQERQNYLANLAAEPRSWMEYAAASGATPNVQPWMLPLMPQQYAGTVAGSPLPGWEGTQTSITQGAPSMAQLPALTTPSAQYLARMGPTAYQQYSGYEQARSGITPEEQQFRLWSQAPPSGQYSQLSYAR